MSLFPTSISALFVSTLWTGALASAASPYSLEVESVAFSGSACSNLSPSAVRASYDPDQQKIIVTMKRAEILVQPDVSPAKARANCMISLIVRPSQGAHFAITSQHFDGVAQMDGGVTTEISIANYNAGSNRSNSTTARMKGPSLGVVAASREIPREEQIWSRCNAAQELNINLAMRISAFRNDTNPHTGSFYTRTSSGPKLGVGFRTCASRL